jgi:hypothetical protein
MKHHTPCHSRAGAAIGTLLFSALLSSAAWAQSSSSVLLCGGKVEVVASTRVANVGGSNVVVYRAWVMNTSSDRKDGLLLAMQFSPPREANNVQPSPLPAFPLPAADRREVDLATERKPDGSVSPTIPRSKIASYVTGECR